MGITASEFLKWCQVFGVQINGGAGSGSYQPNGGVVIHNFSDGNLLLTNPPQTSITLLGDDNPSAYIRLAAVNEPTSLKEGANFQITNNCSVARDIYDFSDEPLFTVLPGVTVEGTLINDVTIPGIYSFKPISGDVPSSGSYQPNNGVLVHDFSSSDLILTNPAPQLIFLTNSPSPGNFIQFPNMTEIDAWPAGTDVIKIYNNSGQDIDVKNNSSSTIYTVLNNFSIEVNVLSTSTANGTFGFNPRGSAATKSASRDIEPYVISQYGPATIGNIPVYVENTGTVEDSAIPFDDVLRKSQDLSGLSSTSAARTNLGLGSAATEDASSFQQNNGYENFSLEFTPNISLSIPTPTYIRVYGQTNDSSSVNLPNMSDPGAWPEGQEVSFFNDGDYRTEIYDALDQSLLIVPPKTIVGFVVTDNGSPGGFRFDISGAETFTQAQTNLQITGLQQTPLFFTATNVSGAPNQQSSFSNGANYPYLQYVQSGLSYAEVSIPMPKRWNQGTFTLRMEWYTTATSGNVVWNVDAAIINSGDSLNPSFGTAVTVTSAAAGSSNTKIVATTGAITPSGTPSANSRINVRIYRNGGSGSDNMAATAFLLNPVLMQWTSSAGNDS